QAGLQLFPAQLKVLEFTEQPPEPWKSMKLMEFGVTMVTGYIQIRVSLAPECCPLSQPALKFTE
ncbi:hypothetical protein QR685DRAFT_433323, partial [Neurospora intermedia]